MRPPKTKNPTIIYEKHYQAKTVLSATHRTLSVPFAAHNHDHFEIELITEGTGKHLLNGRSHPLGRGSMYLLTPADVHAIETTDGTLHYVNLSFREDFFSDDFAYEMLLACRGTQIELPPDELPKLCTLFDLLIAESQRTPDSYSASYLKSLLQCILVTFLRRNEAPIPENPAGGSVRSALFYLQRRFREPITLEETAAYVHLSPHYFCALFREETGMCFSAYVNRLRIRYARRLLLAGQSSVTEVCYLSGFRSFSTFSRAFLREFGCSPTTLRAEKRG